MALPASGPYHPGMSATPRPDRLILVRLAAELGVKSHHTRRQFQRQLIANVRAALATTGAPFRIDGRWGRIFVRSDAPDALLVLPRVFGVSSVSPVDAVVPADLDAIASAGLELYRERVRGRTYAVRARRTGRHAFSSHDVQVRLGAALNPYGRVHLDDPEVTVAVEVRDEEAYLFGERIAGAGGLPLGVQGRAVALLSGGYDSAVAAWLLLKRGVALDFVFCNLGGDAYERAVLQVAKVVADDWSYGQRPHLHALDFGPAVADMRQRTKPAYWQLVLKRLMYRAASRVAQELGAHAIITGEALGQVSSQTLINLRALEPAASFPVFRPLIGFDKEEIIARARRIGTAALSERVKEYCAIAPGKPVTAAPPAAVAAEERKLDPSRLDAALAGRRVLDLHALSATDLVAPYLFASEVPDGARVVDCRTPDQYRTWHYPGAEQRDEWDLLQKFSELPRDPTYILYCAHGIQSAYLAEKMQRAGYEAYSFKGGVGRLMRYAGAAT
jgi:tRNA uracil 4-sulfurtransferase